MVTVVPLITTVMIFLFYGGGVTAVNSHLTKPGIVWHGWHKDVTSFVITVIIDRCGKFSDFCFWRAALLMHGRPKGGGGALKVASNACVKFASPSDLSSSSHAFADCFITFVARCSVGCHCTAGALNQA